MISNVSSVKEKHHTTVCTFVRRNENSGEGESSNGTTSQNVDNTSLVSLCKQNSDLLLTARGRVTSIDDKTTKNSRLLFDIGSQLSYISPNAREELKLPTIGKQNVAIKTFGNAKMPKKFDVVKFAVKSTDNNLSVCDSLLVSDICYPVEEQRIDVAQEKYTY